MDPVSKPIAPLPMDTLHNISTQAGPAEGTSEHQALEDQKGFSYRTLLGEIMYAYVSCRPDIGYPITLMSKYASNPSEYHYDKLKNIARYLHSTRDWGIIFKRSAPRTELPEGTAESVPIDSSLPVPRNRQTQQITTQYSNQKVCEGFRTSWNDIIEFPFHNPYVIFEQIRVTGFSILP